MCDGNELCPHMMNLTGKVKASTRSVTLLVPHGAATTLDRNSFRDVSDRHDNPYDVYTHKGRCSCDSKGFCRRMFNDGFRKDTHRRKLTPRGCSVYCCTTAWKGHGFLEKWTSTFDFNAGRQNTFLYE